MIVGSSQDTLSNWANLPEEPMGWNEATVIASAASDPELIPIPVVGKVVKSSSRLRMVKFMILEV